MGPNLFISAGEASGEHYGALLIQALRRQLAASDRTAAFFGMGGDRMAAAGLDRVVRAEDMAVMGITEVVRHLPRIYAGFRRLRQSIRARRPDLAILIDFPDIHFRLAAELHRLGVPVLFFVSPQLWAWKKRRIKLVQKYVTRMLVIFPFEEPFYRERGVAAEFVGHPLADLPAPAISREHLARIHALDPAATWIGLLPGSRPKEIRANLPEMLAAARSLATRHIEAAAASAGVSNRPDGVQGLLFGPEILAHTAQNGRPAFHTAAKNSLEGPQVSGHHFSRAANAAPSTGASQAAEKLKTEEGGGVNPRIKPTESTGASAPEILPPPLRSENTSFSAASFAPEARETLVAPPPAPHPFQFIIPLASTLNTDQRAEVYLLAEHHGSGLPIRLVDDARATLHHARASIVASGTATVEAALIGNPFVVVYRVSPLTWSIARRVVTVPHVAMCNLIAGHRVVPELIQDDFTAAKIVHQIEPLLSDGPPRQSMMKNLRAVGKKLRDVKLKVAKKTATRAINKNLKPAASLPGSRQPGKPDAIDRVAAIALELLPAAHPVPGRRAPGRSGVQP